MVINPLRNLNNTVTQESLQSLKKYCAEFQMNHAYLAEDENNDTSKVRIDFQH